MGSPFRILHSSLASRSSGQSNAQSGLLRGTLVYVPHWIPVTTPKVSNHKSKMPSNMTLREQASNALQHGIHTIVGSWLFMAFHTFPSPSVSRMAHHDASCRNGLFVSWLTQSASLRLPIPSSSYRFQLRVAHFCRRMDGNLRLACRCPCAECIGRMRCLSTTPAKSPLPKHGAVDPFTKHTNAVNAHAYLSFFVWICITVCAKTHPELAKVAEGTGISRGHDAPE